MLRLRFTIGPVTQDQLSVISVILRTGMR